MADADRCVCCGEIVPEGRQICPQCECKRYIYTIPDIPPSLNKFAGRENVWAYRADKKQWQALCAAYCRPKKTYAQDFFEKFPKAQSKSDGTPFVCRKRIYGGNCYYTGACYRCWNEPMEE